VGLNEEALTLPLSLTKGEATQARRTFHCPNAGWRVQLEKLASASGVRDKFTIQALARELQHLDLDAVGILLNDNAFNFEFFLKYFCKPWSPMN
jgi:hypothetical protein